MCTHVCTSVHLSACVCVCIPTCVLRGTGEARPCLEPLEVCFQLCPGQHCRQNNQPSAPAGSLVSSQSVLRLQECCLCVASLDPQRGLTYVFLILWQMGACAPVFLFPEDGLASPHSRLPRPEAQVSSPCPLSLAQSRCVSQGLGHGTQGLDEWLYGWEEERQVGAEVC